MYLKKEYDVDLISLDLLSINKSEFLIVKTGIFKTEDNETKFISFSEIKRIKYSDVYVLVNNDYLICKSDKETCEKIYKDIFKAWVEYKQQNILEEILGGINSLLYAPPSDGGPFYKEAKRNFTNI